MVESDLKTKPNHNVTEDIQDRRKTQRRKFFLDRGILAELTFGSKTVLANLIDLNFSGVGLVIEHDVMKGIDFRAGTNTNIKLLNHPMLKPLEATVISSAFTTIANTTKLRISIKLENQQGFEKSDFIWLCEENSAYLESKHPMHFSGRINFKLIAFNSENLLVKAPKNSKDIISNINLDFRAYLAHFGMHKFKGTLTYIEQNEFDHDLIRINMENPSYEVLRSLADIALYFSTSISIRKLKKMGLPVYNIDSSIHVTYPSSHKEIEEILKLRHVAAVEDKRIEPEASLESMWDEYDNFSRQVIFKIGDTIVGAMRVTYVENDRSRSEIINYAEYPDFIWKNKFLEIGRFVIHPDYRGGDVYSNLIRFATFFAICGGYRYIVCDARKFLTKVYSRIGAKSLNKSFKHPFYPNENMYMMYWDMNSCLRSAKGNFLHWSKVVRPIMQYASDQKLWTPNIVMKFHLKIGLWVDKLVTRLEKKRWLKKSKKFQKI